jgi:hypothetical protein
MADSARTAPAAQAIQLSAPVEMADGPGTVGDIIDCARQAPHAPGAQPWTIDVIAPGELVLRRVPAAGQDPRQATIAGGAALFHIRVAARRAGFDPVVHTFPRPADPDVLALVMLEPCDAGTPDSVLALSEAVGEASPLTASSPDTALLAAMGDAALLEGAWLHVLGGLVEPASRPPATVRPGPAVALIGTPHDTAHDWLAAGQAFGRILLLARSAGTAAWSSFGSVAGAGRNRPALAVLGRAGVPQLLLQVGHIEVHPVNPGVSASG